VITAKSTTLPRGRADEVRQTARPYPLYGICIHSELPLPCRSAATEGVPVVELRDGNSMAFAAVAEAHANDWFRHTRLQDGADHLHWKDHFQFLVAADGRRIDCRADPGRAPESLHAYLLGQVLSFALIKLGIEPLHGTAMRVGGGCIAFLGDCGAGKSTLAAALLGRGHALLTDDLLVLRRRGGGYVAHPGLPRLKIFPEVANAIFGGRANGVPLNDDTPKMILPLCGRQAAGEPLPLRAMYLLEPGADDTFRGPPEIVELTRRDAAVALMANTFNLVIRDPERLAGLFAFATEVAGRVPVKRLRYRRDLAELASVGAAVVADAEDAASDGAAVVADAEDV
jgi:hypothetical protein